MPAGVAHGAKFIATGVGELDGSGRIGNDSLRLNMKRKHRMSIFTRTLSVALICLASLSAQTQAELKLESAETCKECHEQHYIEWKNSAHAHFSRNQNVP